MRRMKSRGLMLGALVLSACDVNGWQPDRLGDGAIAASCPQDASTRLAADAPAPAPDAPREDGSLLDTPAAGKKDAPAASGGGSCPVLPGQYADGMHPASSAAFAEAFARHAPWIGCAAAHGPFGSYAHPQAGVDLQDFFQPDAGKRISSSGWTALVYNPQLNEALLLQETLWQAYACLKRGDEPGSNLGGAWLLGAPTNEQYPEGDNVRQDFALGWMTLGPTGSALTIYLREPRALPSGLEDDCEDQGVHIAWGTSDHEDGGAIDAPARTPICTQAVDIAMTLPTQGSGAEAPSCRLDPDGAVVLEYADTECPADKEAPFRGCEFAWNQDLRPFDPLQGRGGAFEIFFCVSGPVNGALNIWYQQGSCKECRYSLPLLAGDEMQVGCRKIFVAPEDVGRDVPWQAGPFCPSREEETGTCMGPKDSAASDSSGASDLPSASDASISEAGTAETETLDAGDAGRPDFSESKLVLMNEWCDPTKSAPSDAGLARVVLRSVVYHPARCLCSGDQDCADGTYCQHVKWPDRACCGCSGCRGLCR